MYSFIDIIINNKIKKLEKSENNSFIKNEKSKIYKSIIIHIKLTIIFSFSTSSLKYCFFSFKYMFLLL